MNKVLLASVLSALSGCASVQQALTGYESAAATAVTATEDRIVTVWSYQACQTPYAAIARNPQIIPVLRALCAPSALLDPVPK